MSAMATNDVIVLGAADIDMVSGAGGGGGVMGIVVGYVAGKAIDAVVNFFVNSPYNPNNSSITGSTGVVL